MNEDMNEIEMLTWMEKRFGITKTVGNNPSSDKLHGLESELVSILANYREKLKIQLPIPKVKTWVDDGKMNFIFLDRKSGRRILLGTWLEGKEEYYER